MTDGYKTKQGDIILTFLRSKRETHLTADDVCEHLRARGNAVGRSTVYRHLDRLVESGAVRRYRMEDASACYQYADSDAECVTHHHLKCVGCGRLLHMECDELSEVAAHLRERHGFVPDMNRTVIYGRCAECEEAKR